MNSSVHDFPLKDKEPMNNGSTQLLKQMLIHMNSTEGWFSEDEALLLFKMACQALSGSSSPGNIVEIGSYCGRSTVMLGAAVQTTQPEARIYAIDPHEGQITDPHSSRTRASRSSIFAKLKLNAAFSGLKKRARPFRQRSRARASQSSTLERFKLNIARAGVQEYVHLLQQYSYEVAWNQPIALLFIDGLHDYLNVSRDFLHFETWLCDNGYCAFHDYSTFFPDVMQFVDELLDSQRYSSVGQAGSLIILQKRSRSEESPDLVQDPF